MSSQTFTSAGFLRFPGVTAGASVSAVAAFPDDSPIMPGVAIATHITVLLSTDGGVSYGTVGKPRSHVPVVVPFAGDVMVQVQPADGPCVGTVTVG